MTMPLAETKPLEFPEADLSQRLMQTAHGFVEDRINHANTNRRMVSGKSESAQRSEASVAYNPGYR